jgi:hypothetical protein
MKQPIFVTLAVAEFGSLRAGRHLGIAQPAVTRSIHEIERELGVSLFGATRGRAPRRWARLPAPRRGRPVRAAARDRGNRAIKGLSTGQVSIAMSSASSIALPGGPRCLQEISDPLKISRACFKVSKADSGRRDDSMSARSIRPSRPPFFGRKLFDNSRVVARKGIRWRARAICAT